MGGFAGSFGGDVTGGVGHGPSAGGPMGGFGSHGNMGEMGDTFGGGESGGDADSTVLCSELYRQGKMPEHIFAADKAYGKLMPTEVMAGYHLWAKPLAKQMAKRKWVTAVVRPFITAWAKQMAHKMGVEPNTSYLGLALNSAGIPVCWVIGVALSKRTSWGIL